MSGLSTDTANATINGHCASSHLRVAAQTTNTSLLFAWTAEASDMKINACEAPHKFQQPPDQPTDMVLLEDSFQCKNPSSNRFGTRTTRGSFIGYQYLDQAGQRSGTMGSIPRQYRRHTTPSSGHTPSITSTSTNPLTYGAIRPGGPVDLFSRNHIGLVMNMALIGFFNGTIPALMVPFLISYLNFSVSRYTAAFTIMTIGWTFKFLIAFLVDCVPINRQRRKPYIIIAWLVEGAFYVAMTLMKQPSPSTRHDNPGDPEPDDNLWDGMQYALILVFSAFPHLLMSVATEGLMIEYAHREGEFVRGRTQTMCLMFFYIGEGVGVLSASLAFNSKEFGGDFAAAVPLPAFFGFHLFLTVCGAVMTKLFLVEDRTPIGTQPFLTQVRRVWSIMQQRTTWQITVFGFLCTLSTVYEVQEHFLMYRIWLGADSLFLGIDQTAVEIGTILALCLLLSVFYSSSWRKLLIGSVSISIAIMAPIDMLTVYGIYRSKFLFLFKALVIRTCDGIVLMLSLLIITEVAEPGYEAVTYGIITTVYSLSTKVMNLMKSLAASTFTPEESNLALDTEVVHNHMMHQYIFKYGLRLAMLLVLVPLLPRQKQHLMEIRVRGNPTLVIPIALSLIFTVLFILGVVSNTLALFESTQCLVIAGGRGCSNQSST